MVLSALMVEACLPPCVLDAALAVSQGLNLHRLWLFVWSSHQSILQTLIHGVGGRLFVWEGYGLELRFSDF